jgi:hypothetical protein
MTRIGNGLLSFLARALEPAEREVVLGDLSESGESFAAATFNLAGLICRRQAGLWKTWRPWLALLALGGLAGVPLSRIVFRLNVDIGQQLMAYQKHAVHFETGLQPYQDAEFIVFLALAVMVWSWMCGFVLGSLSGRSMWLTWSVFYLVVLNSAWARFVFAGNIVLRHPQVFRTLMFAILPLSPAGILFSLPALWGVYIGGRRRMMPVRHAYLMASAVILSAILATWMTGWYETAHEVWSEGVWRGVPWPTRLLPFALVSWPAGYLLATAYQQSVKKGKLT